MSFSRRGTSNGSMPFDVPRREKGIHGGFVGYFHDAGRRPRDLIEALCCVHATRPGSRFAFVGWKPSPFAETLAKALREGGVRADLVPPVPREEVGPWMARAKVGLISLADHPVFRTAVGAKTYEYLRAGLPVAALGVSGDSELRRLIEGEGVGVFSADVGEFAAQLAALLSNEARLGALSQRASRLARAMTGARSPNARIEKSSSPFPGGAHEGFRPHHAPQR